MVSDSEGQVLVQLARLAVQEYLKKQTVPKTSKPGPMSGVFVSLHYLARNKEHLRGCIGFPQAYKTLPQSVIEAAIAAATQDPRFPPVSPKELDSIIFEVSVLTEPEEIATTQDILIGRDGLILKWRYGSGLLLPQVPVELGWNIDEYLSNLYQKAAAPPDVLNDPSSKLYRFQAEVFKELEPSGRVVRFGQYK